MITVTINFETPASLSADELAAQVDTIALTLPPLSKRTGDLDRRHTYGDLTPQEECLLSLDHIVLDAIRKHLDAIRKEQERRATYFTERDRSDPDDGERKERRRKAKEIIADYMGVPVDDVHIICSGDFGDGGER